MSQVVNNITRLLADAVNAWFQDHAARQAAALAYYGVLSLAPLLIVAISIAGFFFGRADVQQQVIAEVSELLGSGGANLVENVLNATYNNDGGIFATIISLILLFIAATNIFFQLKTSLNQIWDVQEEEIKFLQSILQLVLDRLLAALMVVGFGFILLLSQIFGTTVALIISFADELAVNTTLLLQLLNTTATIALTALVISFVFRFLPDKQLEWRDVWVGALFTAVLFSFGQRAISFYIENGSAASAYGVAGSLIVVLLWIYYSASILLFGAEFTQAYARHHGSLSDNRSSEIVTSEQEASNNRKLKTQA